MRKFEVIFLSEVREFLLNLDSKSREKIIFNIDKAKITKDNEHFKKNDLKMYTFDQIKDEFIGEIGTERRTQYEQELQLEIMGEMIRKVRMERNLTQEELGKLIGVQRAQISKLENNTSNVTMQTILKVFGALKAKVNFNVELINSKIQTAR